MTLFVQQQQGQGTNLQDIVCMKPEHFNSLLLLKDIPQLMTASQFTQIYPQLVSYPQTRQLRNLSGKNWHLIPSSEFQKLILSQKMMQLDKYWREMRWPFYARCGTVTMFGDIDQSLDWQKDVKAIINCVSTVLKCDTTVYVSLSNFHTLLDNADNTRVKRSLDTRFKFHFTVPSLTAASLDIQQQFWSIFPQIKTDKAVYRSGSLRPSLAQKFDENLFVSGWYCQHFVCTAESFDSVGLDEINSDQFSFFFAKQAVFKELVFPVVELQNGELVVRVSSDECYKVGE